MFGGSDIDLLKNWCFDFGSRGFSVDLLCLRLGCQSVTYKIPNVESHKDSAKNNCIIYAKKKQTLRFINCHIDSFRRYHTLRHKHCNMAPENRPSRRKLVFQPSVFRGELLVSGQSRCFFTSNGRIQPALLPISKRLS